MKLVITGGAGFIGSNFVHHMLLEHPDYQITVVDKLTYAGNLLNLNGAMQNPRLRFLRLDVCDPSVIDVVHGADAIVHFAAESHVDRSIEDASPFLRTNVEGTWRMVEASRLTGVERFVQVSTDEVYGSLSLESGERFTETSPLKPSSPYAASKAAADLVVLSYVRTYGFPAIITRCSNNYGPYQFPEKFIPLMISQAIANRPLPVYGDGQNVRDWIHVSDHCRALDLLLHKGKESEIYNVGAGCELANIDVALQILKALDRPEDLVRYVSDRLAHDRRYALDCQKLRTNLGWSPEWNFDRGLEHAIRWYQENQSWLTAVMTGEHRRFLHQRYGDLVGCLTPEENLA